MELLKDLIKHIAPQRLKRIETLNDDPQSEEETRLFQLYKGIQNETVLSEEQAAKHLYDSQVSQSTIRVLKMRLVDRLMSQLFFIDDRQLHNRQIAIYKANKNLFCARVLSLMNARFAARIFMKKALAIAEEFQITEIAIDAARSSRYTSSLYHDSKAFNYFCQITNKYQQIYNAEILADEYNHRIALFQETNALTTSELSSLSSHYCEKIFELRVDNDSFELASTYYRLLYRTQLIARDYNAAVQACQECLAFLNKNSSIADPNRSAEFQFHLLNAYLILRKCDEACKCAESCKQNTQEGSYNWFLVSQRHIIACIQSLDFHQAFQLFQHAFRNPQFNKLPEHSKDAWKMIEVYLNYIFDSNWANDSSRKVTWFKKKFSLPALLKQAPALAKDKAGSNVALLVVQILYLLEEHDFDQIANRVEALKVYVYRHLNKPDTVRSKLFIKLLLIMDKHGYEYKAVKKATEKTFSKLLEETPDKQPAIENAEVIPFDILWPRILEKLKAYEDVHV